MAKSEEAARMVQTSQNSQGASQTGKKSKIDTKALIQSGAFAAIYAVVMVIIVMGSAMINPALYLVSPLTVGIFTGTIFVLSVLKVKSFIPVIVMGALFFLMAGSSSIPAMAITIGATAISCLILVFGHYGSKLVYCASFVVFNLTMAAPFAMLLTARDTFITMAGQYYGETYASQLDAAAFDGVYFAIVGLAIVGGLIGAFAASKLVDKHFKKAGVV